MLRRERANFKGCLEFTESNEGSQPLSSTSQSNLQRRLIGFASNSGEISNHQNLQCGRQIFESHGHFASLDAITIPTKDDQRTMGLFKEHLRCGPSSSQSHDTNCDADGDLEPPFRAVTLQHFTFHLSREDFVNRSGTQLSGRIFLLHFLFSTVEASDDSRQIEYAYGERRVSIHFTMAMDGLHRDIVAMCSKVEENISAAVKGLQQRSGELAAELQVRDREVDQLDIHLEEECLRILALYHPVANDLRRVTAVLKIAGELERVGDIAVNLADRAASISLFPDFPMPALLNEMTDKATTMLHRSIDAYVDLDANLARNVCAADDEVDDLNVTLLEKLRMDITQDVSIAEPGLHLFSAIRQIERVADHATNIAEDVVYLVEGTIIRHGGGASETSAAAEG